MRKAWIAIVLIACLMAVGCSLWRGGEKPPDDIPDEIPFVRSCEDIDKDRREVDRALRKCLAASCPDSMSRDLVIMSLHHEREWEEKECSADKS